MDTAKVKRKQELTERRMVITTSNYERLIGLREFASPKEKMPDTVLRLCDALINERPKKRA